MSQANVDFVLALQLAPDVDLVPLVRDEGVSAAWQEAVAPYFMQILSPHIACLGPNGPIRVWMV